MADVARYGLKKCATERGDLARWLRSRRYARAGSDVDRALDELDPSWRERRLT